jgi:hypothetical protein
MGLPCLPLALLGWCDGGPWVVLPVLLVSAMVAPCVGTHGGDVLAGVSLAASPPGWPLPAYRGLAYRAAWVKINTLVGGQCGGSCWLTCPVIGLRQDLATLNGTRVRVHVKIYFPWILGVSDAKCIDLDPEKDLALKVQDQEDRPGQDARSASAGTRWLIVVNVGTLS